MATFRRYFVAGLLVWIPLGITLWVLKLLVDIMDQSLLLVPEDFRSDKLFGFHLPGLGIILTVAIVLITGALAANFFGRKALPIVNEALPGRLLTADGTASSDGKGVINRQEALVTVWDLPDVLISRRRGMP